MQGCSRRNRTLLQACSVRAPVSLRGPFRGKSFELPRRKARGDGRGATEGAAGFRRAQCRGDSKRLGARGSAWPCVSEVAAAARAPVPIEIVQLERGARVPRHFLELCEWFRDCSQASGASQRVQRASAPRPTPVGCGADGPAQHGPPRGRSRDRALLNSTDARLPCCSGSRPCQCGARRSGVARVSVCCAPRVASGCSAGRSGLSVRRPAALRSLGARRRWFRRRARLLSRGSGRACDPNPFNTLRTHVLQPARSGASRACGDAPIELGASLCACFAADRRSVGGAAGRARFGPGIGASRAARQATWLILPVVICLSQRLSHACLSISDLYCETANGSLNQLWFL